MTDLVLSYSFMTKPSVLQAGNTGSLTIIVSNSGPPVEISSLEFVLSMGSGARDIAEGVTPKLAEHPDGWSFPAPSGGNFNVSPPSPVTITRQGLIFVFELTVSSVVGTAQIAVTEHLVVNGQRAANHGNLSVPKFPQDFALDSFYSARPIVNQGDAVTLVWTGQNLHLANYQISYLQDGQQNIINIPANTYSYTLADIDATSNFYLHVTSTQAADTRVMLQSQQYLVSVNPAIAEFWATSAQASPGDPITLNWTVASSVESGRITCLQSGEVKDLDQAAIKAGSINMTAPAIGMTTQFRLDVFDSATPGSVAAVAWQLATVTVTANIPHSTSTTGYFLTTAQAADVVSKFASRPVTDTVVPRLMEEIFATFKIYYPEIDFYLDWDNATANTESFIYIDGRKKVVVHGGLVRLECLYYEAFCFIVAQAVARLSGTAPVDANKLTYVGMADFVATSLIMRQVFFAVTSDSDLQDGVLDQLKTLFRDGISPANQKGNPNSPATDPGIACRYKALNAGVWGSDPPACVTGASAADTVLDFSTMPDPRIEGTSP